MPHLRFVVAITCALAVLGCELPNGAVIDGWPIGTSVPDCVGRTFTPTCDQLIAAATTALDARDGPHPPVVGVTLYYEDTHSVRTISSIIAVFVLSDGSRRAIFTSWSPGGSITLDYGP